MTEIQCEFCGEKHRVLERLPSRPVSVSLLSKLEETDNIIYTGPTAVFPEGDDFYTNVVVVQTQDEVKVASFYPEEEAWCVTYKEEAPEEDEDTSPPFGVLINEMASTAVESGHQCITEWWRGEETDTEDSSREESKKDAKIGDMPTMGTSIGAPDCPECGSSHTEIVTHMDGSEVISCIDCGSESETE